LTDLGGRAIGLAHGLALIGLKLGCDLAAVLLFRGLSGPEPSALLATLAALAGWVPALAVCALYAAAMEPALRPRWRPARPYSVPMVVVAGALTIVGAVLLALLAGDATTPLEQAIQRDVDRWAVAVFAIAVTPVVEEWFFRGFLYQAVSMAFGEWGAVLVVGLLFGLFHGAQYAGVPEALAAVTLMGLVTTWMRKVTGGILACVIFHAAYNVAGVVILFAAG